MAASVAYASGPAPVQKTLEEQVRHEINMLPYYGVFDYLSFRVDGNKVTLMGQVWQPWLKQETVNAVKHIEGIAQVDDQIEVLPLSSFDDRIRWQEVRAIYGYPALNRYGLGTHPSIHIIVKNGNVTLKGVVANTVRPAIGVHASQRSSGSFLGDQRAAGRPELSIDLGSPGRSHPPLAGSFRDGSTAAHRLLIGPPFLFLYRAQRNAHRNEGRCVSRAVRSGL